MYRGDYIIRVPREELIPSPEELKTAAILLEGTDWYSKFLRRREP
jgi:hypothetical protein